jgi:hypothetical protein
VWEPSPASRTSLLALNHVAYLCLAGITVLYERLQQPGGYAALLAPYADPQLSVLLRPNAGKPLTTSRTGTDHRCRIPPSMGITTRLLCAVFQCPPNQQLSCRNGADLAVLAATRRKALLVKWLSRRVGPRISRSGAKTATCWLFPAGLWSSVMAITDLSARWRSARLARATSNPGLRSHKRSQDGSPSGCGSDHPLCSPRPDAVATAPVDGASSSYEHGIHARGRHGRWFHRGRGGQRSGAASVTSGPSTHSSPGGFHFVIQGRRVLHLQYRVRR